MLPLGVGGAAGAAVPPAQRFLPGAGRALPPPAAPLAQRRHLRRLAGGLRSLRALPGIPAPPRSAPRGDPGGEGRRAPPGGPCASLRSGPGGRLLGPAEATPSKSGLSAAPSEPRRALLELRGAGLELRPHCGCCASVLVSAVFSVERRQGGKRESIGSGSLCGRYRPLWSNSVLHMLARPECGCSHSFMPANRV